MDTVLFSNHIIQKIDAQFEKNIKYCQKLKDVLKEVDEIEATALKFIYGFMPISDIVSYDIDIFLKIVRQALFVRNTVEYASKIPPEIFLNYVLFYRVNNENIEDYRLNFYNELYPRIKDKSMKEAALEVNYWCFEKATYQATDGRTASPNTVIRRAYGRCGEESTLTVSAMRSVGIPARQCYTPRWAHCDDNHAWVEIWADGKWYYLGACEPEPVLNKGWFTSAASKAMLVHSKAFSNIVSNELIAKQMPVYCEINNTTTYGKCKKTVVKVIENNKPIKDITVQFEIINYSELFPIFSSVTDENGIVEFTSGIGSLHLHAHDNKRFITKLVDLNNSDELIVLDFSQAVNFKDGIIEFDMNPPKEDISSLENISKQKAEIHNKRVKEAEQIRSNYEKTFFTPQTAQNYFSNSNVFADCAVKSRGNYNEIIDFYKSDFNLEDKENILLTLKDKDFCDITNDLLCEYLECSKQYKSKLDIEIYRDYILAPRIANEMIVSTRPMIKQFFKQKNIEFENPIQIENYINNEIKLMDKYDYPNLCTDVKGILNYNIANSHSAKILFVAICRTFGFPARLNKITGEKEFFENNKFISLSTTKDNDNISNNSKLTIVNESKRDLNYFVDISIAKLIDGKFKSLMFEDLIIKSTFSTDIAQGNYRIITSARQIDGGILAKAYYFDIKPNENKQIKVSLREDRILQKLKYADIEYKDLFKDLKNDYCILAFTEPGKEPTEHLFNEIIELKQKYNDEPVDIIFTVYNEAELQNNTLNKVLEAVPKCKTAVFTDTDYIKKLHKIMGVGDERLPFVIVMNKSYQGLFAFANYNVGTAKTLLNIIDADKAK